MFLFKGKGVMETFWLIGHKLSSDSNVEYRPQEIHQQTNKLLYNTTPNNNNRIMNDNLDNTMYKNYAENI